MRRTIPALIAAAVFAAALHWGTFAAGGSDSSCYLLQARQFAELNPWPVEPLALQAPWPDAELTFAPAGHVPSRVVRGAAAPICPSGLSLVMAPFAALHRDAPFVVIPLFGAWLVLATWRLGRAFGERVGLAAAAVVACSPAFLFQLMQPMSDVPAAALWTTALAGAAAQSRRGKIVAGASTAAALLMRPNLLPIGVAIGLWVLLRGGSTFRLRLQDAAVFAACVLPGVLGVALMQALLHGSPLQSGYGSLASLFSWAHIAPNAGRYGAWTIETQTPFVLLALLAPFLPGRRSLAVLLLAAVAANVACYLPYTEFDDWWYLRFLLPSIPACLVLAFVPIEALTSRAVERGWPAHVAFTGVAGALCATGLAESVERDVFRLERLESRFVAAGTFAAQRLPANALVIASAQSGSVRFYARRPALVWDVLDPASLEPAIAFAHRAGYEPFLMVERVEEPAFRQRFGATSALGALDWPPMAEIASQVRVYRPGDRRRYLGGAHLGTEYVR